MSSNSMGQLYAEPLDALLARYSALKREGDRLNKMTASEIYDELREKDPETWQAFEDVKQKYISRLDALAAHRAAYAAAN